MSQRSDGGDQARFETISEIVSDTRDERLTDDFSLKPERLNRQVSVGAITDPLLGYCHENARLLAKRLSEHGFEPHIIWGSLSPSSGSPPETIPVAEEMGLIHFWVEVAADPAAVASGQLEDTEWIVCEIAAEPDGGTRVTKTLPETYHYLPESRMEFDPSVISSRQLRNLEGHEYIADSELVVTPADPRGDADPTSA